MTPFNSQRDKYINAPNYVTPFNNQDGNPQLKKRDQQDRKIGEVYSQISSAPSVHSAQNPQSTQKSERVMIARAQGTNGNQNSEVKPMPPKAEERSQEGDLRREKEVLQEEKEAAKRRRLFEDEEFGDVYFRGKLLNIK
jgi:hypothetical protein